MLCDRGLMGVSLNVIFMLSDSRLKTSLAYIRRITISTLDFIHIGAREMGERILMDFNKFA